MSEGNGNGNGNGNGKRSPLRDAIFAVLDERGGKFEVESGRARQQLIEAALERYPDSNPNSAGSTVSQLIADGVLAYPHHRLIKRADVDATPAVDEPSTPVTTVEEAPQETAEDDSPAATPASSDADTAVAAAVADDLLMKVIKIITERHDWASEYEQLEIVNNRLQQEIDGLRENGPESLQRELSSARSEVTRLNRKVASMEDAIKKLEQDLSTAREHHGKANAEIVKLRDRLSKADRDVERLYPALDEGQRKMLANLISERRGVPQ